MRIASLAGLCRKSHKGAGSADSNIEKVGIKGTTHRLTRDHGAVSFNRKAAKGKTEN
jgi:hypothetical protein